MMKKLLCAFSGWCLLIPLTIAQTAPAAPAAPSEAAAATAAPKARAARNTGVSMDAQLFYQVLLGELIAGNGEPAPAVSLILDAARKSNDARLYQRATDLALESRSGEVALQAARAWQQAQPASIEARRYILQILLALNRVVESADALKALLELTPAMERPQALSSVPRLYARVSDKKAVPLVVEQALAPYFNAPPTAVAAWVMAARLRLAANNKAGALEAVQRGHAANRLDESPVMMAIEMMAPSLPAAEALVRQYLSVPGPAQAELRFAYARNLLGALRYPEALTQLQIVTRDKPDFAQGWLVLGSLQLQEKQAVPAEAAFKRYLSLAEKQPASADRDRALAQAFLALSQIAEKRQAFAEAESWLKRIDSPEVLVQAQSRRAALLARQGQLQAGIALIRELPERKDDDARNKLFAEVALLKEFKQLPMAYERLGQAVAGAPQDIELIYEQAMTAEKLNLLADMERLLRRAIEIKPDYAAAYNALGYSLADRNVRLPEAKQLIQKALEFAPADPFIRDSLGWVEFRLGNLQEAARILGDAYKDRPDPEIAAHLGEVLWSLQQRDRALAVWREGHMMNPDNETLQETLQRLRVKL
ncbi:MAG: tetratricopeptide repeat protein [Polaromonas sp.]|jgi:tetratricopeptide (TPR) repeat protein|nr:tetratricopeptide repeat protein [Polaromonas sp.]